MVVEEESTEGAEQTLEVTVLARSTQAMPMDSALRRTLREIRQIAAERRELEALRQRAPYVDVNDANYGLLPTTHWWSFAN